MEINDLEQCLGHGEFLIIPSNSINSNRNVKMMVMGICLIHQS